MNYYLEHLRAYSFNKEATAIFRELKNSAKKLSKTDAGASLKRELRQLNVILTKNSREMPELPELKVIIEHIKEIYETYYRNASKASQEQASKNIFGINKLLTLIQTYTEITEALTENGILSVTTKEFFKKQIFKFADRECIEEVLSLKTGNRSILALNLYLESEDRYKYSLMEPCLHKCHLFASVYQFLHEFQNIDSLNKYNENCTLQNKPPLEGYRRIDANVVPTAINNFLGVLTDFFVHKKQPHELQLWDLFSSTSTTDDDEENSDLSALTSSTASCLTLANSQFEHYAMSDTISSSVAEKHGIFRVYKHDSKVKELIYRTLPFHMRLAPSISRGDCFFDSIAQALNSIPENNYTVTNLRELCHKSVVDYDRQYQFTEQNWIYKHFYNSEKQSTLDENLRKEYAQVAYHHYMANIRFTANEIDAGVGLNCTEAIWGKTELDGKIICQQLGIKLHVIEFYILKLAMNENEEEKAAERVIEQHTLVDANTIKTVDSVTYDDKTIFHIVGFRNHFVPLLDSSILDHQATNKTQATYNPSTVDFNGSLFPVNSTTKPIAVSSKSVDESQPTNTSSIRRKTL